MSADNLDLSRVQRPVWDMERRYGETRNPDSMRFSLLINRMVFTPRKDPPRPPSVLAADNSQEVSDTSPRKRLSGHLCSRPLKPAPKAGKSRSVVHASRGTKREQVAGVPTVVTPPTSSIPTPHPEHQEWGSGTGPASSR